MYHQASPCHSTVCMEKRAVFLLKYLSRPQTTVHVSPLILAQVQQPACFLWSKITRKHENPPPLNNQCCSHISSITYIRFQVSVFLAQRALPLIIIITPSSVKICFRKPAPFPCKQRQETQSCTQQQFAKFLSCSLTVVPLSLTSLLLLKWFWLIGPPDIRLSVSSSFTSKLCSLSSCRNPSGGPAENSSLSFHCA